MIIRADASAVIIDNLPDEGASNANPVFNEFGANAASSIGEDAFSIVANDAVRILASIPRSAASAFRFAVHIDAGGNRAGDCSIAGAVRHKVPIVILSLLLRKLRRVAKHSRAEWGAISGNVACARRRPSVPQVSGSNLTRHGRCRIDKPRIPPPCRYAVINNVGYVVGNTDGALH